MSLHLQPAALFLALGGGAFVLAPQGSGPSGADQAAPGARVLADWAPHALVYVELPDLERMEADLAGSSLARLWERVGPALGGLLETAHAHAAAGGLDDEVALRALELAREGFKPRAALEAAGRHMASELGLPEEQGARLMASLEGPLSACVLAHSSESGAQSLSMALASGLQAGASVWIAENVMAHLERADGSAGHAKLELLSMERPAKDEVRALWRLAAAEGQEQYLVLRPRMLAWSSGRGFAQELLAAAAPSDTGVLAQARRVSRERNEFLWARISGDALRADPDSLRTLEAAGLEKLEHVLVGLGVERGQLATRVRLQGLSKNGLASLLTASKATWSGLELITADTLAVAGLPRNLREIVTLLPGIATALNPAAGAEMQALLSQVMSDPLFQPLFAPETLLGETILFVRPGAAMTPMPYLALAAAPRIEVALAQAEAEVARIDAELARARALQPPPPALPPGRVVRVRELGGERCLVISASPKRNAPSIAFLRAGPGLLVSNSSFSIENWLRQRGRERIASREELVASLRTAPGSTPPAGELVAFVHVRTQPLVEWVWPVLMMGVKLAGASDLEGMPDAVDVADMLGDTRWRLYRDGDALELRASGLLGGWFLVL